VASTRWVLLFLLCKLRFYLASHLLSLSLSLSPRHASPLIFPNHDMLLLSSSPTSAPLEDKGFGGGKASQALDMAEEQGPCWRWRRMGQVEIGEL